MMREFETPPKTLAEQVLDDIKTNPNVNYVRCPKGSVVITAERHEELQMNINSKKILEAQIEELLAENRRLKVLIKNK